MRILFTALCLLATTAHAELILMKGHVRAMPPGQPNTAAFMVLKNMSSTDVQLISASTPVAKKSEFHTHRKNDKGVMSMSRLDQVLIKANSEFEFKSGHHHVMIMGLNGMLKVGESVPLTLQDSQGRSYTYDLPVQSITAPMDHQHHHHQE